MAAQKEMIRIRLKAYDHQLIDQSAEKIVETLWKLCPTQLRLWLKRTEFTHRKTVSRR